MSYQELSRLSGEELFSGFIARTRFVDSDRQYFAKLQNLLWR